MSARLPLGRPRTEHAFPTGRGAVVRREIARSIRVIASLAALAPSDVVRRSGPAPGPDLVTMIIPMRNARPWIELCLTGVLAQTHANLEVFCVDDCSTDDSYERVVRQFGADRRLCVVRLQRRAGPYQIKNWVISTLARGRFVAMQDADDVSHPARIARQVQWMRRAGVAVSGTYIHQFSLDGTRTVRGTAPVVRSGGQLHNLVLYPTVAAARAVEDFTVRFGERRFALAKHGSQMYARDALRAFGGFDGRTAIVADTDLNWRMLRFVDLGNVPEVLYSRRIHADSLTRGADTGYGSPARQDQRAAYDRLQQDVARRRSAGDERGARALCTQDGFCGDVAVAEMHAGFDPSA